MWHGQPISSKFQEFQESYLVFWDLRETQSSKIWTLMSQHFKNWTNWLIKTADYFQFCLEGRKPSILLCPNILRVIIKLILGDLETLFQARLSFPSKVIEKGYKKYFFTSCVHKDDIEKAKSWHFRMIPVCPAKKKQTRIQVFPQEAKVCLLSSYFSRTYF